MKNSINIQYTNFQSINEEGVVVSESIGYRIYDNYGQDYDNRFKNLSDLKEKVNEETIAEILKKHKEFEDYIQSMPIVPIYLNGIEISSYVSK